MRSAFFVAAAVLLLSLHGASAKEPSAEETADWAASVELPESEKAIPLFNGKDLEGWEGQIEKYWSVREGVIRAANDGVVPVSTYLFTKDAYREFRLLMEVKQTMGDNYSTMHSAVCVLGKKYEDQGDPFSFRGPLLMFCHDWGIWDANRRNRIYPKGHNGFWQPELEKKGEWNQIEVFVLGNHIRMATNGEMVIDMVDEKEMLQKSPIGLQLHSNDRPQEFHFRGLILSEKPEDRLLTLKTQ